MARLGDVFTTRVPASVNAALAQANADAENYIADYNIYMGNLRTEDGRKLWQEDKILLSHWNLRDELKALYADKEAGNEKQEMIYQVMQRIVRQDIPAKAVNGADYVWKPYSTQDSPENYKRYERILAIAHALFEEDKFCPAAPTGIQRNFEVGVEITAAELDSLFRALVGSEQVQQVAAIIRERLGRDLRPYDIWYDGFKARASLNEDELTALTRKLYPDANAFAADMPRLLTKMGFYSEDARRIAHRIVVEPARGSGHAWPSLGRKEDSRLRTRIPAAGMDYKGYNIAVHEFGHCVEQVLDMYFIDHYMLSGVPNTQAKLFSINSGQCTRSWVSASSIWLCGVGSMPTPRLRLSNCARLRSRSPRMCGTPTTSRCSANMTACCWLYIATWSTHRCTCRTIRWDILCNISWRNILRSTRSKRILHRSICASIASVVLHRKSG